MYGYHAVKIIGIGAGSMIQSLRTLVGLQRTLGQSYGPQGG